MPEISTDTSFVTPFQPIEVGKARFLLRELDWGEHFVGTSLNPAMGNNQVYIYSLKEMLRFLTQGGASLGVLEGSSRVGFSWLEPQKLLHWLRNALQDDELADALEAALSTPEEMAARGAGSMESILTPGFSNIYPYLEQLQIMAETINMRIFQLEQVVAEAE